MSKDLRFHAVPLLSGAALIGSCVLSFFPALAAAPISAAGVAISSIILSYWMTQISEKERFEEQKKEIGRVAIRRAQNLSDDLTGFSEHLREQELTPETVGFWLDSKARDALTSLDDIRDMAGMTGDDSTVAQRERLAISQYSASEKSTSIESVNVSVSCVKCGTNNQVFLPISPTSTRTFSCKNCEYRQNVHRLVGGDYKVSDPLKNAYPLPAVKCPQCEILVPMPKVSNLAIPVRRLCLNCASPFEYVPIEGTAKVIDIIRQKNTLKTMPSYFSCQCGKSFEANALLDRDGRKYFACFGCLRSYYIDEVDQ